MSRTAKRYVCIFFWEGYLSVAPSLMNAIQILRQENTLVHVIIRTPFEQYAPVELPEGVKIAECLPISVIIKRWLTNRGFRKFSNSSLLASMPPDKASHEKTFYEYLKSTLIGPLAVQLLLLLDYLQFLIFSFTHTFQHRYCTFIGVDIYGLVVANILAKLKRVEVIYWSLELYFMHEMPTWLHRQFKTIERQNSRQAKLVLIQDRFRAESLIQENNLDATRIRLVPNAPMGFPKNESSSFFRDKFALSSETHIILQTGMISSEALALEVATVSAQWKSIYTLVLHDRMQRDPNDPYIREIEKVSNGSVRLSLTPVPFEEIDRVIKSGQVGLVLYRNDLGANFSRIVGASGKMAYYLRCGLPVICSDLPGMQEMMDKYHCGICVRALHEIEPALDQIFENYDAFSKNALQCYKEQYEFGAYFQPVLDQIVELCEQGEGSV